MTQFYFDVWPADDVNGTALGELTQAYDREWTHLDQAIGSGQFTINRHDSQYLAGWCAQDNLIRVRLVAGGPFDYDDERYVHAFFIENGNDEVVSVDEEGGDEITRGGRDAVVILRRAVVNFEHDFVLGDGNDGKYWVNALTRGVVTMLSFNPGAAFRVMLRNAAARSPNPLAPSTHDFDQDYDSANVLWGGGDTDWDIPIGTSLLDVLGIFAGSDMFWRMTSALVMQAFADDQGVDRSADVLFERGFNIRESATKEINTRESISRALVQGTKKNGGLTYQWVSSPATETELGGRREGFIEYEATPTADILTKAGTRAIRNALLKRDGPTSIGVEENVVGCPIAFEDYVPGDSVTINVPGEWDDVVIRVYGIAMTEDEAGEALVTVLLSDGPIESITGGDSGLGGDCNKCPPLPPHQPGTQEGEPARAADATLTICNNGERNASGTTSGFGIIPGETVTWRITQSEHHFCAFTQNVDILTAGSSYYHHADGAPSSAPYGPIGPGGVGPALETSGTFVVSPTDIATEFTFAAATNGYADPCTPPFSRDCWTLELWHGDIDLDGTPDVVRPPSTGQEVPDETPAISIGSSTTTLTLDWPYALGSPRVRVDGVLISPASYVQTSPSTGVITLSWAIDADETVTVTYQAAT